jgi:hypothetical protein
MTTLSTPSRPARAAAAPAIGVAVVVVLGAFVFRHYQVVSKVPLRGSAEPLYTIRFFDAFNVKVLPERRLNLDFLNAYLILFSSSVGVLSAVLLRAAGRAWRDRLVVFFGLTGAGMLYLGTDELTGIHESLGRNFMFLADLPGITHPDDVFLPVYALIAGVFVWRFRRVVAVASTMRLAAAALGVFVVAAALDVVDAGPEEQLEVVAAMLGVAAFIALAVHHLLAALSAGGARPSA